MSNDLIESTEIANLENARRRFSASLVQMEQHVNQLEDNFSEATDALSGRKIWRDHFWVTAAGTVAVGLVIGRPSKLESSVQHLLDRMKQLEGQTVDMNPSRLGTAISSVVKHFAKENPTLFTSILGLGVSLIASKPKKLSLAREVEVRAEEQILHH